MRKVARLTLVTTALSVTCCNGPNLTDNFVPGDVKERPLISAMQVAPIAVVGRVVSVRQIGGVRSSASDPPLKVELVRVRLAVENVLKGPGVGRQIDVYYFQYSAYTRVFRNVFLYRPRPGDYRIFFLREEAGVFRAIKDVSDFTLEVYSGSHQNAMLPPGSPGQAIAWVLLTPGEGIRQDVFAKFLYESFGEAAAMSSEEHALGLLGPLLRNDDEATRKAAAEMVTMMKASH